MRLPGFCMSRATTARVRVNNTQSQQCKQSHNSLYGNREAEFSDTSIEVNFDGDAMLKPESNGGNRVMVVVDSGLESKGALQWTLSHSVQSQDTIVLLHVAKPSKQGVN